MTDDDVILVHEDDGVFTLTLNRPEKRNALNAAMHRRMHALLDELRYDPRVRVLILTGAGDAFCAGQDVTERFDHLPPEQAKVEGERVRALSDAWRNELLRLFPAPTIAAVNGSCFGGGFSLVCVCDIAFAAEEAGFGLTEINFKHFPGAMLAQNLTETLRGRELLYYAMTGERFDGKRAAEIGLVTKAVPKAELASAVAALAQTLKAKDPIALRMCKDLYKLNRRMNYEETYAFALAKSAQADLLRRESGTQSTWELPAKEKR